MVRQVRHVAKIDVNGRRETISTARLSPIPVPSTITSSVPVDHAAEELVVDPTNVENGSSSQRDIGTPQSVRSSRLARDRRIPSYLNDYDSS